MELLWPIMFLFTIGTLAYQRASLQVWSLSGFILLLLLTVLSHLSWLALSSIWLVFLIIFLPLYATSLRQSYITRHILKFYRTIMPSMSKTEREALAAGTVGWEGELFRGMPHWDTLLQYPKPQLTEAEQAFLQGPVEQLCSMVDDWDVTHRRGDLPPAVWQFIKDQGFFGLIIPKQFGGKAFSAYAHSQILTKLYSRSVTVATTVSVPNSLGPAELLLHYGTAEQQNYYLPRLAAGEETPCFALTGPDAGSDASAMKDKGVVCWGDIEGKKVLGICINWNKRYITLAPVATLIGLAFKLYDPDHLLGDRVELGITCALIPRHTPGITIGRRHYPATAVFQNGPIQGKDVFIPVDWIIGGAAMVGQGWRMLMECLAAGRAISLPASMMGGAKLLAYGAGTYARIRRQFNVPIGRFEGVEDVLARIAGYTYLMDAARTFTVNMVDLGEKPAVASAIAKYHITELGRQVANDGMDIHGGKGVCLGPKNYMGRSWQAIPIAITVEGANILTRNMIIFGQGAMRCHPYIFAELQAAKLKDEAERLAKFDQAILGHMSFTFSNFIRSFILGLTSGYIAKTPKGPTKRYFQYATRFSAAFAFLADVSLIQMGGSLKRKEYISARLGDILSYLYLISAVLKHYADQGKNLEDLPIVEWACQQYFYQVQQKLDEVLKNFPNRWLSYLLRWIVFPLGKNFSVPRDTLTHQVGQLLLEPTGARARIIDGVYLSPAGGNFLALLEQTLHKVIAAEPIEKTLKIALHDGLITGNTLAEQAESALANHIISPIEFDLLLQAEAGRQQVIAVDDFSAEEFLRGVPA